MQIMVVDDDAVSRFALIDLLNKMGFTDIMEFPDGQAAWNYLECSPLPVLCCCDVRMPNMSGIDLLQKVRQTQDTAGLSFVLITSGSDRETVQQAIVLGVAGYIVKPFNADDATTKLNDILGKSWKNITEDPQATANRLSIPIEKLAGYYGAFKAQVDQFIALISATSDASGLPDLDSQIDAMKTGCLTLGLWHCSRELDRLSSREDRFDCLIPFLLAVNSTVDYQRDKAKA